MKASGIKVEGRAAESALGSEDAQFLSSVLDSPPATALTDGKPSANQLTTSESSPAPALLQLPRSDAEISINMPAVIDSPSASPGRLQPSDSEDAGSVPLEFADQQIDPEVETSVLARQQDAAAGVIQSLSADMHAAMQQLLADKPRGHSLSGDFDSNAHNSGAPSDICTTQQSLLAGLSRPAQAEVPEDDAAVLEQDTRALVTTGQLSSSHRVAELQSHGLPQKAGQHSQGAGPHAAVHIQQQHTGDCQGQGYGSSTAPWGSFHIPKQAPRAVSDESPQRGLSGMELHLMHQLEGLERSVQRVEEQVSSNKQTRRLLKAVATPVQASMQHRPELQLCSPCLWQRMCNVAQSH